MGPKKASTIAAANAQLDNLARVLSERGVEVTRTKEIDWTQPIETPFFKVGWSVRGRVWLVLS